MDNDSSAQARACAKQSGTMCRQQSLALLIRYLVSKGFTTWPTTKASGLWEETAQFLLVEKRVRDAKDTSLKESDIMRMLWTQNETRAAASDMPLMRCVCFPGGSCRM